jgi:hypothetical protein
MRRSRHWWLKLQSSSVNAPITARAVRRSFVEHAPHFRGLSWVDSVYQHARLADRNGILLPDYIGRFETLQEDFDRICERVGIPRTRLPHLNSTAHRLYKDYYDDETREMIAVKYRRDIRVFGYDFEGLIDPETAVRQPPFPI